MDISFADRFLKADTRERLRLARDPSHQEDLRALLGDKGFGEYQPLAGKLDEGHLDFNAAPNVIFVPGVMGSLLQSRTRGGIWWLDVRTRNRIDHLGLSPDGTTDAQQENDIVPATSDPSYDPFLAALLNEPGLGHRIFAYDWRKSLRLSAAALRDLVIETHDANGGNDVHIVAHSMGGLMTRAMLMEHGEDVLPRLGKIVFVGTPHFGSPAIAGYLKNHLWGFDLMVLLGQYLSRSTFRSLYGVLGMLPAPRGLYPGTRTTDAAPWQPEEKDDPYVHPCANFDLYQADAWRLGLGPDETNALQRVLDEAARFHQDMFNAHVRLAPDVRRRMLVIAGVGYQTLFRLAYEPGFLGLWEKAGKIRERVHGDVHREGDGRVPVASAALDNVEVRFVKGEHGGLPNIPAVYREVFRFLKDQPLQLPTDMTVALGEHLAGEGDGSEAPHLDGSSRIVPFTDDPGYWRADPLDAAKLSSLDAEVDAGRVPEFARLRIL